MMWRRLYIWLLWRHPRSFRQRFGDEMLEDFDESGARNARWLVADAFASLFRQWVLRPEFRDAVPATAPGAPMFLSIEDYRPRRGALLWGGTLSAGILSAVFFAIGLGGKPAAAWIGIHRPGTGMIPVARAMFQEGGRSTEIRMGRDAEEPLAGLALFYFRTNRVARNLDLNRDLVISGWEILTAPAALIKLDFNGDGELSAEECGFHAVEHEDDPEFVTRARMSFMRIHPLLAALDANHDGTISGTEIQDSSAALRTMDRNKDGFLLAVEVLPDPAVAQAALILLKLDANDDGRLSRTERASEDASPLRSLLDRADYDRDGTVTEQELTHELQRRIEIQRQMQTAGRTVTPGH